MKKAIFILSASMALYASCKKDDNPTPSQNSITGKWTIVSTHKKTSIGGVEKDETINATPGDYVDVRSDGYAYGYIDGEHDTTGYKVLDNSKIVFFDDDQQSYSDTAQIKTLTKNSLVLFQKYSDGADYMEVTQTLKK